MFIPMLGPPCAFAQWGTHLIRHFCDIVLKEYDVYATCFFDEFRSYWDQHTKPHVLAYSDCPERRLIDFLMTARVPTIIFLEEPEDIVGFAMRERNIEWLQATRLALQCLCSIHPLRAMPWTLVIRRSPTLTLMQIAESLARALGIELTEEHRRDLRIRYEIGESGDILFEEHMLPRHSLARPIGQATWNLPEDELESIRTLTRPFRSMLDGSPVSDVVWPRDVFLLGVPPYPPPLEPIDLTGPGRCLIFGPFMNLPPGQWMAKVKFRVSENLSGNRMRADVYTNRVLMIGDFVLPEEGEYEIKCGFTLDDGRQPVELRLSLLQGAIEGKLELLGATITGVEATVQPARTELSGNQRLRIA